MIKLSIIIPYYNRPDEIQKLIKALKPQLTNETEVLIVDDHSEKEIETVNIPEQIKIIRLEENSGGASVPRNEGIEKAQGKYITFIDSDDMVEPDYIKTIIDKINSEEFDYCYISWKSKANVVIIDKEPPKWNCCVWNCIYSRQLIGNERFDPKLKIAEDYDFNKRVRKGKRANITKILYYYETDTPNSLIKQGNTYNDKYKGVDK